MSVLSKFVKKHRQIIRHWIPQGARDLFNYWSGHAIRYHSRFADWPSASAAAKGYDDDKLLQQLIGAAIAVKEGKAAWEQDGIARNHIPLNLPLFAALTRIALANEGRLTVLDFGGALGSSYFQCRDFLADVRELSWVIVEQPKLVEIGQHEIARDQLTFCPTIEEAVKTHQPNVALFSSVLQYLEHPWAILKQIISADIPYLIIDRHPCTLTNEMITVQVVPPSLYTASYPSWLFDCSLMLAQLASHYQLLMSWETDDPPIRGWGKGAKFHGYFLQRKGI